MNGSRRSANELYNSLQALKDSQKTPLLILDNAEADDEILGVVMRLCTKLNAYGACVVVTCRADFATAEPRKCAKLLVPCLSGDAAVGLLEKHMARKAKNDSTAVISFSEDVKTYLATNLNNSLPNEIGLFANEAHSIMQSDMQSENNFVRYVENMLIGQRKRDPTHQQVSTMTREVARVVGHCIAKLSALDRTVLGGLLAFPEAGFFTIDEVVHIAVDRQDEELFATPSDAFDARWQVAKASVKRLLGVGLLEKAFEGSMSKLAIADTVQQASELLCKGSRPWEKEIGLAAAEGRRRHGKYYLRQLQKAGALFLSGNPQTACDIYDEAAASIEMHLCVVQKPT
jgi:hypothetical protein